MHGSWQLGVAQFLKGQSYYATFFGNHEECAKLCLSSGGCGKFHNVAQCVDGAVEADWFIVVGYPPEELMACSATLCTSF